MDRTELRIFYNLSLDLSEKKAILDHVSSFVKEHENNLSTMINDADGVHSDIARLGAEIARKQTEYETLKPAVEAFINTFDDELIQTLMRLHYLRGLTWADTGAIVRIAEESAKKRVYRALDSSQMK